MKEAQSHLRDTLLGLNHFLLTISATHYLFKTPKFREKQYARTGAWCNLNPKGWW